MGLFQFEKMKAHPGLIHGVSTAEYGNMSYLYGEQAAVQANRRQFFEDLGIPESSVAIVSLVHGHRLIDVTEKDRGRGVSSPDDLLEGDILATNKPETYLFFVVADCLGIFYFDPVNQVCALAHAGWKGVSKRVPRLTVDHLVKHYRSRPEDLLVGMSPAISADSAKFEAVEQAEQPEWKAYLEQKDGFWHVDTTQYAYDQLIEVGVKPGNIERPTIDTRTSANFFSHRRSVEEGAPEARFGCLIGIKKT